MDPNLNTGNSGPGSANGMNQPNQLNLPPQPMPEMGAPAAAPGLSPEALSARAEAAPPTPPPAAPVTWLPPSVPVKPPASTNDQAQAGQAGQSAVPDVADDGDVIEKEWVLKAKQIVGQTRQDPHKQTKELHKFRAEYMKKRYNKVIEPVDE